jgi:hypothetical protein
MCDEDIVVYNFGRLMFILYLCMEMEPMAAIYPILWSSGREAR